MTMTPQDLAQLPVFIAFVGLMVATVVHPQGRSQLRKKTRQEWLLDGLGLTIQGMVIPLLQVSLVYWLYQTLLPGRSGTLTLPFITSFLIGFILVDYLYYWNHRLLHQGLCWRIHRVHHTVTQMDVLGTSRNTLWASLLIIYLWIHPLFIYLLSNPIAYLLGVSLTAALDLWRHSRFFIPPDHRAYPWLAGWLILPQDHTAHHSREIPDCNYGANLKLWDRIHGTYCPAEQLPSTIGVSTSLSLLQKLFFPFP